MVVPGEVVEQSADHEDTEDLLSFEVEVESPVRLDAYLAQRCNDLSRSRIKQLILDGQVAVGDTECLSPSQKLKGGEVLTLIVPEPIDDNLVAEDIPLEIIYEDDHLLVINKPAGMVVHPAPGHSRGTLVNALLHHCGDSLSGIGGVKRPGIVHRLDKETSGLIMVAKSDKAHKGLSKQLANRSLSREYLAVVWGVPTLIKDKINVPVGRHPVQRQKMAAARRGGRHAVTYYLRKEVFRDTASIIQCHLESGRTHQIRVHLEHIGFPVMGDPVYKVQATRALSLLAKGEYGDEAQEAILAFPRQALHARAIRFIHPISKEEMSFESEVPADIAGLISCLKSKN